MIAKKPLAVAIILLFISVSVIPSSGTTGVKKSTIPTFYDGNTLYVGGNGTGNYTSIQDAINDASDGDTVFVYEGIYHENLIINKSIDLIGETKENTVIDGRQKDDVVVFDKCHFNIRSLTIRNGSTCFPTAHGIEIHHNTNESTIKDCILFGSMYGISVEDSSNICIQDCHIFDNIEGIMLINASYCEVNSCKLSNRQRGVSVYSEYNNVIDCSITGNLTGGIYGIDIYDDNNNVVGCNISNEGSGININSNNNKIENCNISNNRGRGIVIGEGENNHIFNTIISDNGHSGEWGDYGIEIFKGFNNIIEDCQILNNGGGGVFLIWLGGRNFVIGTTIAYNGYYSFYRGEGVRCESMNYIYKNNFIDNQIQAYDILSNSIWDDGELGNFWDDYKGFDLNNNGIGDLPKIL